MYGIKYQPLLQVNAKKIVTTTSAVNDQKALHQAISSTPIHSVIQIKVNLPFQRKDCQKDGLLNSGITTGNSGWIPKKIDTITDILFCRRTFTSAHEQSLHEGNPLRRTLRDDLSLDHG